MARRASLALPAAAAVGLAILGWREFFFLTDDAFIAFRYASNAVAGRGLVWNPAPFLPVEGYTCFLWVALLRGVWQVFGVEPPQAVVPISLAFGLGSLALAWRLAVRLPIPRGASERGDFARVWLVSLVLLGVVSNRTFLAWLSSGLETALFNFVFTAWIVLTLERGFAHARSAHPGSIATAAWALAAAAAALTRPDGWLAVGGTIALLAFEAARSRRGEPGAEPLRWQTALAASPLVLPLVHLGWRRLYYGAWLPNTYYAKHLGAWPESGLRYAASFALEYALWLWLAAALLWLARDRRLRSPRLWRAPAAIAVAVVIAHFGYYTLIVGGDHFEYRVYSYLIPLLFVSFPWLLLRAGVGARTTVAAAAALVVLSWPIPWAHHIATRDLTTRLETHVLIEPVAPHLPPPLSWIAGPFDDLQAWLIPRHVCMRHREHAVYLEHLRRLLPSRAEGAKIAWEGRPVLAAGNVGLLGWVLPNVAILDMVGLNDYVVARTPPPDDGERLMAHDRVAPPAYLACFQPNVRFDRSGFVAVERPSPLDDATILRCEREFRGRAGEPLPSPHASERSRHEARLRSARIDDVSAVAPRSVLAAGAPALGSRP